MRTKYNILVRDKVPEILEKSGKTCVYEKLSDEQYIKMLAETLLEEAKEYLERETVEELVDIGEVMHAILAYKNVSVEQFQKIRTEKLESCGGYKNRVFLKEVKE